MAITPFRQRIKNLGPGWLTDGTGERLMYVFGAMVDARMEKVMQGTAAHLPTRAQPDALPFIGADRLISQGLTESPDSYAVRLQTAFDAWRLAGTSRAVLSQILGALLALTPKVEFVATRYDRSTYPPTRVSSKWDVYPVGRSYKIEPVTTYANAGGAGDWDWDSLSQVTGSWGWWGAWVVLFSVAPNAFCQPAQAWGTGSAYTPGPDGYYSTISGDEWVDAGSYTGSSQAWGAGSTYAPAADGYYSVISGDEYLISGIYNGVSQAWGVDQTTDFGQSIALIVGQFKSANTWVRSIIVSFSSALFDVTQTADGVHNPAGTFGQWSIMSGDEWVSGRFDNAVYSAEVTT